ncbi:hypothetical protein A7J15_03925 [Microbacterium sediminis]|uniref:O-antigen ligase-related domain-containing protein n=1 Tax=Microbacterium sediminis TaxID=904291 RepID=A0A1B9NDK8_9MICO|nr:hypothetical protein A7J15_03925 [Microbacterium sediminis]
MITLLLTLVLVGAMFRNLVRFVFRNYLVVGFVAWSLVGLVWSEDRISTLTTVAGLGAIALLGAAMALLGRSLDIGMVLMWTFTATSLGSLLLVIAAPQVGAVWVSHPTEGLTFQPIGLFAWNSDLGFSAAVAAILALAAAFTKRSWWLLLVVAFNGFMVWYSNSAASMITLLIASLALLLMQGWRWAVGLGAVAIIGAAAGMLALTPVGFLDRLLGLLGRSSNLTGRVNLWAETLAQAMSHPVLGAGAGVEPDLAKLTTAIHSHNGFIQVFFDRGAVGILLFAALIVMAVVRAARNRDTTAATLIVAVVIANLANNYLTYASLGLLLLLWVSYRGVEHRDAAAEGAVVRNSGDVMIKPTGSGSTEW